MSKQSEPAERNWYVVRADIASHPKISIVNRDEIINGKSLITHLVNVPALACIRPLTPEVKLSGKLSLRDYMELGGGVMLVAPRLKELLEVSDPEGFDFMRVQATFEGHGPADYWLAEPVRALDAIDEDASDVQPIMYDGAPNRQYHGQMRKLVVKPGIDVNAHVFRVKCAKSKILFDQALHDRIKDRGFTGLDMRISTNQYDL